MDRSSISKPSEYQVYRQILVTVKPCPNCGFKPELTKEQKINKIKQRLKKNIALNIWYKNRHIKMPWLRTYALAKQRCQNPNVSNYKWYGGKGIKLRMTKEDFKSLWFRDKAYLLKQPSIDRIDPSKDYIKSNCRYIEFSENFRRAHLKLNKINCRNEYLNYTYEPEYNS